MGSARAPSEPRPLGRGGESVVLAGPDQRLPRDVAWKVARADDPAGQARLAHEARVLAMLEHPSIVPVYDLAHVPSAAADGIGGTDSELRLALKEIRGHTLGVLLRRPGGAHAPRAREPRLIRHLLAATEALAWAHAQGVVHRDVKPDNIMVGAFGETQVIDWSLAQIDSDPATHGPPGAVFGTPRTMSPEQARGEAVGPTADVWALGATLFEIVVGRPLQADGDAAAILERLRAGVAPDLSQARDAMAPELFAILERALAPLPEARYPDARAFADDLAAFIDGRVVSAHTYTRWDRFARFVRRRRLPLAVGATLAGTLAVAGTVAFVEIRDERDLALAASESRRQALISAGIADAERELAAGRRPEAEAAARAVLALDDRPEARGILAAISRGARLQAWRSWPIEDSGETPSRPAIAGLTSAGGVCVDLDVSPDGRLAFCGARDRWRVSRLDADRVVELASAAEPYREARLTNRGLWLAHHDNTLAWLPLAPEAPAARRDPICGGPLDVDGEIAMDHRMSCVSRAAPGRAPVLNRVCAASDIQTVAQDATGQVALCRDGAIEVLAAEGNVTTLASPLASPSRDHFASALDRAGRPGRSDSAHGAGAGGGSGRLLIGTTRGAVLAVDLASGAVSTRTQLRSERMVRRLALTADHRHLLAEVDGDGATVLDRTSLEVLGELPGTERLVRPLDDGHLVTLGRELRSWDLVDPALVALDGLIGVTSLSLWPDGILGVTHSHTALLLDANTGVRLAAVTFPAAAGIAKGLLRLPAGPLVGIAYEPNADNLHPRRSEIGDLTFATAPTTRRLLSLYEPPQRGAASLDGLVPGAATAATLWARARTGASPGLELVRSSPGVPDVTVPLLEDRPVDAASDGPWLAALRADPGRVTLFDTRDAEPGTPVATCADALATSLGVALTADGPHLLTTRPGSVRVFGVDCADRGVYDTPGAEPVKVVGTRSGLVVAGTRDGALWAWDANGRLRARVTLHREPVAALALDPLGRWALSGAWDGRVRFLDLDVLTAPVDGLTAPRGGTTAPR